MKFLRTNPYLRNRYLAAIVAGLLLTGGFPKIDIAGCAWIAPGLMAVAALGKAGAERWRIGYVAGLAHYLSMLDRLLFIPYRWNGIPFGPALGWIALSAFVALFTAAWVWLVTIPTRGAGAAAATSVVSEPELWGPGAGLPRSWLGRTFWALFGAASWVALEMVLARIFGGFPWDLLGVSQYRMVTLIQVASITGVYGVSFIIVWVSLALVSAALMVLRRPTARSVWIGELFVPLMVVAALFNHGLRIIRGQPPAQRTVSVTLVQPSIPQTTIWDPRLDTNRFNELVAYTDQILTNKTDVLIWPESAVPKMVRYDQDTFDAISGLAKRHGVWMIIGSDDAEPRQDDPEGPPDYFNSSFLISPEGRLEERYRKRSLVIFGEYVPFERWLPFLKWFTPTQGGFKAGTGPVPFRIRNPDINASVLICFEDVFPQIGRLAVDGDTDFLVNITNDGWFGNSAAQWQQAATGLFRAVENRVPLIRCCNNGVSCWIDAQGRIRQVLRDAFGTVYGKGYLIAQVDLPEGDQARTLTYYTRHGDVFGWACVAITGVVLVAGPGRSLVRRLRRGRAPKVREP